MKHLAVSSYGASLGVSGSRLVVRDGEEKREIPLSRLRTICLMKNGMSISTDLLQQCGLRGIKVFILGGRGDFVTALHGLHDHGLAKVREAQFHFLQNPDVLNLAAGFISGKLRNQRSLLLYFSKYHKHLGSVQAQALISGVNTLTNVTESLHTMVAHKALTLEKLLGLEGGGAASYWTTLRKSNLLPDDFPGRIGRGAEDPGNMMLNYGYAILSSTIWSCIVNAGLEAYCGFLHQQRPGKPSLVLDLMEEYRDK